jgi:hypothetical protein
MARYYTLIRGYKDDIYSSGAAFFLSSYPDREYALAGAQQIFNEVSPECLTDFGRIDDDFEDEEEGDKEDADISELMQIKRTIFNDRIADFADLDIHEEEFSFTVVDHGEFPYISGRVVSAFYEFTGEVEERIDEMDSNDDSDEATDGDDEADDDNDDSGYITRLRKCQDLLAAMKANPNDEAAFLSFSSEFTEFYRDFHTR